MLVSPSPAWVTWAAGLENRYVQHNVAVAVAIMCCSCTQQRGDAQAQMKRWNALISKQLPRGASSDDVESFFTRHGLETGPWSDGNMSAIKRDVEIGALVSTSISFLCRLDSTGRLDECRAELVHRALNRTCGTRCTPRMTAHDRQRTSCATALISAPNYVLLVPRNIAPTPVRFMSPD